MTLAQVDRMSEREIQRWMAWERIIGVLGCQRGDIQTANIAAEVRTSYSARRQAWDILELLPFKLPGFSRRQEASTPEEMFALLRALGGAGGPKQ